MVERHSSGTERIYRLRVATLVSTQLRLDAIWDDALNSFAARIRETADDEPEKCKSPDSRRSSTQRKDA